MVKRKLASVTASLALLIPTGVLALGLGNISMNSALDQHLEAEIIIRSATAEDLEGLKVNLASDAMFIRYGIDRPEFLEALKFEVVQGSDGKSYIQVSSSKPIREPFLNFLVEAKWPSGHALRQFTVLVDPPTMMEAVPLQVVPARVATPRHEAAPITNQRTEAAAPRSLLHTDRNSGSIEYGPSRANDTLWGIATAMRGDRDVTVHQVMLAILRDNPDAFYRGNVNNLKMGYVLRINDPSTMTSLSKAEAEREVSRQYREWKNGGTADSSTTADSTSVEGQSQSDVTSVADASDRRSAAPAQLKLTSAGMDEHALAQAGVTSDAQDSVNEQLAIANEQLLANHQETTELTDRLVKLEGQLDSLQRLVQLKDSELAAIQQSAKVQPQPVAQPEPEATGLFDSPLALALIALVIGLIAALGFLLYQRRKQDEFQESILSQPTNIPMGEVPAASAAAAMPAAVTATTDVAKDSTESSLLTDFSSTSMEGLQSDIGEIDPISEADVYLAYGRYTQAEEIIKGALQSDPEREEYHTKLLEIYHAGGEKEKFLEAAQSYHGVLGGNLLGDGWVKVCAMGRELQPESALFAAEGGSADHDIPESSQVLSEVESPEVESSEILSSQDNSSEIGVSTDEIPRDEMDEFNFNELDDKLEQLGEKPLDEAFTELESSVTDTEKSDDNALEFESGSLEALNTENSLDEAKDQQLNDDIASNSLEFGSDSFADKKAESNVVGDVELSEEFKADEPRDEGSNEFNEAIVAEEKKTDTDDFDVLDVDDSEPKPSEPATDLESDLFEEAVTEEKKTGTDDFDVLDVDDSEPKPSEPATDLESDLFEEAVTEEKKTDTDDFEVLDADDSERKSSEPATDLESDLFDAADSLDDSIAAESTKDKDDLDKVDLGSMADLMDDSGSDFDDDNPFADLDEVGTKLDLARAYVDMGDKEGAQSIIDEVMQEGTDEQKEEAQALLKQL